jgi:hypothetical protein
VSYQADPPTRVPPAGRSRNRRSRVKPETKLGPAMKALGGAGYGWANTINGALTTEATLSASLTTPKLVAYHFNIVGKKISYLGAAER